MSYQRNKELARTLNTEPTLTDQAAAKDTDINRIVASYKITGQMPQAAAQPVYADFSELPDDLRGMMETAKALRQHMDRLPPQLRNLGPEQLLALKGEDLKRILTPPVKPTDDKKDEQK